MTLLRVTYTKNGGAQCSEITGACRDEDDARAVFEGNGCQVVKIENALEYEREHRPLVAHNKSVAGEK